MERIVEEPIGSVINARLKSLEFSRLEQRSINLDHINAIGKLEDKVKMLTNVVAYLGIYVFILLIYFVLTC